MNNQKKGDKVISKVSGFNKKNSSINFGNKEVPKHRQVLTELGKLQTISEIAANNVGDGGNTGLSSSVLRTAAELFAMAQNMTKQAIELLENKGTGTVKVPFGGKHQEREFENGTMLRNDTIHLGIKAETLEKESGFIQRFEYDKSNGKLSTWTDFYQDGSGDKTLFGEGNSRRTQCRKADGSLTEVDNISESGKTQVRVELDPTGKIAVQTEVTKIDPKTHNRKSTKIKPSPKSL